MKVLLSRTTDSELFDLRAAAPKLNLVVCNSAEDMLREVAEAAAAVGLLSREVIAAGKQLKWVQVPSAGVESYMFPELVESDIVLTNAKALYGTQLAEHAIGFALAFNRNFHLLFNRQREEVWEKRVNLAEHELAGETMMIVGLGGVGMDIAWRAHAFTMKVIAVSKHHKPRPDFIAKLAGMERFHEFLGEADYVCTGCALTPETRKLFGAREFAAMKPSAYFINLTRGGVVDTEALVRALEQKQIAGAGLDVTDPEPLPPGHPLWHFENVLLTPHTSGQSPHANARLHELVKENLRRFQDGEPLLNVVDKRAGY